MDIDPRSVEEVGELLREHVVRIHSFRDAARPPTQVRAEAGLI
jgi:hypothetical protein